MTPNLNALDRAIAWVSPSHGLKRARDRAMLTLSYDGARKGRSAVGWTANGGSANAAIGPALAALRQNSRDLYRNEPLARKAINEIKQKTVGTGILPRSKARNKKSRRVIDERFSEWMENCDAEGRLAYPALQALGVKTILEAGEVITRYVVPRNKRELLHIRLLEPDYIDHYKTESNTDGYVIQGVQFDSDHRRVGYWLHDSHPGDVIGTNWVRGGSFSSQLVPAQFVEHGYQIERLGQVRGVPRCAPVVSRMRDLGDIEEAIRIKKKVEACFAAFLHDMDPNADPVGSPEGTDAQSNLPIESIEPGMVKYLRGNQNVTFANPSGNGAEPEYIRLQQRMIAAGWLVPYEILTGDLSQVNYSSYRGGLLGFRDMVSDLRWNVVVPWICTPVYRRFVDLLYLTGEISEPDYAVEWSEPAFDMLDRGKEAEADQSQNRLGTLSWGQMIASQGFDPDKQIEEIKMWNEKLDKAGIILDGDPRRITVGGKSQVPTTTQQEAQQ